MTALALADSNWILVDACVPGGHLTGQHSADQAGRVLLVVLETD